MTTEELSYHHLNALHQLFVGELTQGALANALLPDLVKLGYVTEDWEKVTNAGLDVLAAHADEMAQVYSKRMDAMENRHGTGVSSSYVSTDMYMDSQAMKRWQEMADKYRGAKT